MDPRLKKVRQQIRANETRANAILDGCDKDGKIRAMTPEEKAEFDGVIDENKALKEQCARYEQMAAQREDVEKDEEEEAEEGEHEEGLSRNRSNRVSSTNQFEGQSPGIHTRKRPYSILRAMRSVMNGRQLAGLEGEVSKEVRRLNPAKSYRGQFSMPIDPSPGLRSIMYPNASRRDLTTSTGVGALFTLPEFPMIDLLRARMALSKAGATFITGLQGLLAIPRQSGQSTVNWIGEGSSAGNSNATLDQVALTPKVAVDITNVSRQFINQTSVSAETFAMNDLAKTMAIEWDRVGINGLGSGSNQPLGILQNSAVQTLSSALAIGTNGGPLTWANVVNAETQVANANADMGNLAYITSPAVRGTLKTTPKVTSTAYPIFIWEDGKEAGVGSMNSYPAFATTNVPSNLTKGSGQNLSALIYGNFADLIMASWDDGIDFLVNPYSNQASAAVQISMEMSVDAELRHNQSFAIITDASYNAF